MKNLKILLFLGAIGLCSANLSSLTFEEIVAQILNYQGDTTTLDVSNKNQPN